MSETQTTTERIENQLNDIHDTYPGSVYDCFRVIAKEIAAEIDALTRERDEARAEVATLTLKLANARLNLKHCSEEVDKRDECAGQLGEARAEVARLRPAAEAWEKLVAFRGADRNWLNHPETVIDAFEEFFAAARAAKEAQP